ncbi:hypothetical protein TIFTF001_007257 [Ficus carica]|uniref:Uncharacterized protein n=1 Tax=Ficus carica TaxID=3494 RepID=A0AA87ZJ50_FICCA|nr:hypothetical protein TIFTF001_007257 [Ficus carica]
MLKSARADLPAVGTKVAEEFRRSAGDTCEVCTEFSSEEKGQKVSERREIMENLEVLSTRVSSI